jgi:hypothetical protein
VLAAAAAAQSSGTRAAASGSESAYSDTWNLRPGPQLSPFVWLSSQQTQSLEDESVVTRTVSLFTPNEFGNVESGGVLVFRGAELVETTEVQTEYYVDQAKWLVASPEREVVTHTLGSASETRTTAYSYYSSGLLESVTREPELEPYYLRTYFERDPLYNNVVSITRSGLEHPGASGAGATGERRAGADARGEPPPLRAARALRHALSGSQRQLVRGRGPRAGPEGQDQGGPVAQDDRHRALVRRAVIMLSVIKCLKYWHVDTTVIRLLDGTSSIRSATNAGSPEPREYPWRFPSRPGLGPGGHAKAVGTGAPVATPRHAGQGGRQVGTQGSPSSRSEWLCSNRLRTCRRGELPSRQWPVGPRRPGREHAGVGAGLKRGVVAPVAVCRVWQGWRSPLALVKPATVIDWHRRGFRRYWRWRFRTPGRPRIPDDHIAMIRRSSQQYARPSTTDW